MFFAPLSLICRVAHQPFPIVSFRTFYKVHLKTPARFYLNQMTRSCSTSSPTSPPSSSSHGNLKFYRRPGNRHPWTEIKKVDEDHFNLLQPDPMRHGWMYGGDLASQALYCAQQTVEPHLRLSSFHSYYISPGLKQPLEFKVKRLRDGRHNSYRRVEVLQGDDKRMVYHAEFMFKRHNALIKNEMVKESEFPCVPAPSELRTSYELFEELAAQKVDLRTLHGVAFNDDLPFIEHKPCNGAQFLRGPDEPSLKQCLWLKYKLENFSNDANFADLILVYLSDMGICFAGAMPFPRRIFKIIASIDLNGWIHSHDNHFSIQPNDYFLYETSCMVHAEKKSLNLGKLWTKDKQLVATFVQDALIEPKPESKI
ncbi:hypothetical protein M3Y97_00460300 [Aphelenchoides bicaudatus]|nr:hypothetical protein M3Y97_00460300 [Aphelenchoides bicaudatus]